MKNEPQHPVDSFVAAGVMPAVLSNPSSSPGALRRVCGVVTVIGSGTPCADVLVTDGHAFARTDREGRYQLTVAEAARWVLAINPAGYEPDPSLYVLLAENQLPAGDVNFTLKPLDHPIDEPFTFVHLSDSHVANPYRGERMRVEFVQAINRMPRRPSFVLDTGDLCINSPEQMDIAAAANKQYEMPYLATIGNHDCARRDAFEHHFRPSYHAFTFGKYLVISLPWGDEVADAYDWTRQLLAELGHWFHVLVSVHHPVGLEDQFDAWMALFKAYDVRGMFIGHYHASQIAELRGMPVYMVRGAVARNTDIGRPCFHLIEAHPDGRLQLESREVDHRQEAWLLSPDRHGCFHRSIPTTLWVSAYDTAAHVRQVEAIIHESGPEGRMLATVSLTQDNAFLWSGNVTPGEDWPSQVYVHVKVVDEANERWNPIHVLRGVSGGDDQQRVRLKPATDSMQAAPDQCKHPTLAWLYGVPGSLGFSQPVLHQGVLYAGVEYVTDTRQDNPILIALDAATGTPRWQYHARACSLRSTPLVTDKLVVIQTDDGRVHALDRQDGKQVWVQACLENIDPAMHLYFRSSPVAVGEDDVIAGSVHLYCRLALEDGRRIWGPSHPKGVRGVAPVSPVVVNDRIVTIQKSHVRLLRIEDGSECWERRFQGVHATPLVMGRTLYVLVNGGEEANPWSRERWRIHVVALDIESGRTIWDSSLQHYGQTLSSPVLMDGSLVMVDYDTLIGMDAATGCIQWRRSFAESLSEREHLIANDMASAARYTDANDGLVVGAPTIQGQRVYLVSRAGTVIAMHRDQPRPMWSYSLNTTVMSSVVVSGNAFYVAGANGGLYALVGRP